MRLKIYKIMLLAAFFCTVLVSVLLFPMIKSGYTGQWDRIVQVYIGILLAILLIFWWLSGLVTEKIIRPINNADFEKGSIAYDELAPFVRRIRDQKTQLNEQLNEVAKEKALLDALSKSMNEGLILVDRDGIIRSVNQSAQAILGVNETFTGRNILEAIRHADVLKHLESAATGHNSELVIELSARTYQIIFSPVENGALMLLLDITEKAKSEKLRREFSANVSHELKTPLTAISGYAELIANEMVKNEDIKEIASKINRESIRLVTLIEDIIRLSQLDEAVGAKDFTRFDLNEVIGEVTANLKQRAFESDITVITPSRQTIITANRDLMYEMIYNLMDNSIKYNKPGGKIEVRLERKQNKTELTVADTGIGIEKKHLSRIFERFYRVDTSRSKKTGGTGLGLSIVKHIAVLHNGTVTVDSKPGVGTSVHILF